MRDHEDTANSQQFYEPPVSTSLTTSSPTCSLNGEPPFTITTTYTCTTSKSIWALIRLFSQFGHGIRINDPTRKNRRIGPTGTMVCDEWDEIALDLEDTELVRLEPGQKHSTSYTLTVVPFMGGLRGSDTKMMAKGNNYEIVLKKRRLSWMFEDEMGVAEGGRELSDEERKEMLRKKEAVEWEVDCRAYCTAA